MAENTNNISSLIDALITDILDEMPLEGLVSVADLGEDEFRVLELSQGRYIRYRIDNLSETGNEELLKECRERSGDKSLDDAGASAFVLKELWKRLRETHRLRVVK
jgi:hypothetical protein